MDMHSRKQYLQALQKEYLASGRQRKKQLLDEAEKRTNLVRKYIIRRLSVKTRWDKLVKAKRSKPVIYGADLIAPLVKLWDIFGQACGARLAPLLKTEVERLRRFGELPITNEQATQFQSISGKTIDRLLTHEKAVRLIRQKQEKKNPLLYQKIPTKMSDEFDRDHPGDIQLDAVEHCGRTTVGEYVNTITAICAASYWWGGKAVMGKGQQATVEAIENNRSKAPFAWTGASPDNGSSFINYHFYRYALKTNLNPTRSRPYQKNDNCFVEQTNSDNVRKYVGHVRYDTKEELALLNQLYEKLGLYKNFFQPVMRLKSKERNKGHIYRKYEEAKTPYQWLMDYKGKEVSSQIKGALKKEYESLNPAELRRQIDLTLRLLAKTYQTKTKKAADPLSKKEQPLVTFSFDSTTPVRLPSCMT